MGKTFPFPQGRAPTRYPNLRSKPWSPKRLRPQFLDCPRRSLQHLPHLRLHLLVPPIRHLVLLHPCQCTGSPFHSCWNQRIHVTPLISKYLDPSMSQRPTSSKLQALRSLRHLPVVGRTCSESSTFRVPPLLLDVTPSSLFIIAFIPLSNSGYAILSLVFFPILR